MAKKRSDKEHDSSSLSKVAKVGAAALAIGGGAAIFNNTPLKKSLLNETLPAARQAGKRFSKELRDLKSLRKGLDKRTTGLDLKKALAVGRKTFEEERNLRKDAFITFNKATKKNLAGQIKNIEQVKTSDLLYGIKDSYKAELQKKEIYKLINKYSDKDSNVIKNLALEAYRKIEENAVETKDGKLGFSNFLKERFIKNGNFTEKERTEFLEYIYNSNKEIKNKMISNREMFNSIEEKFRKELDKSLLENKKVKDTLFGKIDSTFEKLTGMKVDSEMLFSGSRTMTVGDFRKYSKSEKFNRSLFDFHVNTKDGKRVNMNIKDIIDDMKDLSDDTIFDKALRIDRNGDIYSTHEAREMAGKMFDGFSSSTLGRIFGMTDLRLDMEKPIFANFKALNTSVLAAFEEGNDSTIALTSKIAIGNASTGKAKLFELTLDDYDNLSVSDVIAEGKIRNNMHGKNARLTKEMLGSNKDILTANDNWLAQKLDIDQSGAPNIFKRIKATLTDRKNPDASKNRLKRLKGFLNSDLSTEEKIDQLARAYAESKGLELTEENLLDSAANIASMILEDNKELSSMLNNITAAKQITDSSISSLLHSDNFIDNESKRMLQVLNDKNYDTAEDLLNLITNNGDLNLFNKDLENIVKKGLSNTDYMMNMQNISQIGSKSIGGMTIHSTNVMDVESVIKRETLKEVMLRESSGGTKSSIAHLEDLLQNSNLTKDQEKSLRYLANWSIMQSNLELYNDMDSVTHLNQVIGLGSPLSKFDDLMTTSGSFRKGYSDMIDDVGSRLDLFDSTIGNINQTYINEYDNYSFSKQSALSRLSQIKDINEGIKLLGEAGKELIAGRNDMTNYTTLTQLPQFMVARLA